MTTNTELERRLHAIAENVQSLYKTSIDQHDRLGTLETRERRTDGLIVKAAQITQAEPSDETRRVNVLENRFNKLENRFEALYDELTGRQAARNDDAALNTLAKAQSAYERQSSAAGILDRAQRVLTDPTAVGIVEAYVQGGQLRKAVEMLEAHDQRAAHADEDSAQERVEGQIDSYDQMAMISELSENLTSVQDALNSVLNRLSRLERPQTAPEQETVVAKGYSKKQRRQEPDYRDSPNGLAERAQGVVDSSSLIGQLNSMLQSGDAAQITQARQTIEAAELRHESRIKSRDRRAL